MQTLTVDLGSRSYPIFIGSQLLENSALFFALYQRQTSADCDQHHRCTLVFRAREKALIGLQVDSVILPDGEEYKTLETGSDF